MWDQILEVIGPVVVMVLTPVIGWLVTRLNRWFNQNSDNNLIGMLRSIVVELVEQMAQISGPEMTNAIKKANVKHAVIKKINSLGAERMIERATGSSMNDFVETTIEAAVHRRKLAQKASESVGKA